MPAATANPFSVPTRTRRNRHSRADSPARRKVQFNNCGPVEYGRLGVARKEDPGTPIRRKGQVGVGSRKTGPWGRSSVGKHLAQGRPRSFRPAIGAVGPLYSEGLVVADTEAHGIPSPVGGVLADLHVHQSEVNWSGLEHETAFAVGRARRN